MTFELMWIINLIMFIVYGLSLLTLKLSPAMFGRIFKKKRKNDILLYIGLNIIEVASFMVLVLPFVFLAFNIVFGIILIII